MVQILASGMHREMVVVPYESQWKLQYELIKTKLLEIFGELAIDIQHIGSTAIPAMPAKPIIDVMVVVRDICLVDEMNEKMQVAGYVPKGENGIQGRRYFQRFAEDNINHTQHIHCFEQGNEQIEKHLMFRDYLLVDKEAFTQYKLIKLEAYQKYRFDSSQYTEHKSSCINLILNKAKQFYGEKKEKGRNH